MTASTQPTLESVLRSIWDSFHPGQPAPVSWLTHTTAQVLSHLRHTDIDELAQFHWQVREAFANAVCQDQISIDVANALLGILDLPVLFRRWQIRISLPLLIDVTAPTREDAFAEAQNAIEAALADLPVIISWEGYEGYEANSDDLDSGEPVTQLPRHPHT